MKILFLMHSPEYLRFYDSVVEELAGRGHDVAVAVNRSQDRKLVGLAGLERYADRVAVLGLAPQHEGVWADVGYGVRATMDFVRFLHPRFASARALRARIKRKVLPRAYHWLDVIPRLPAAGVRAGERLLGVAERAVPVCAAIADFLAEQAPDVLLISPLVNAASEQVDWVKAARAKGIRTAVCIASWDNLTNKGLLRVQPDLVLVWNEAQKREARDYHYVPEDRIAVTGAQLFDRWFARTVTRDRLAFCRRAGLPDDRAFLLFTGSSAFISESRAEVAFVRHWIEAVRACGDPALRTINILFRPHPYNCEAWEEDPLRDLPGVAVFPRRAYNPVDADSRADFFDSMYHAAAVVGINTSAMIEAAIVGRPVFSIAAPEFAATQEGTIHFHHLLPENGGCVRIASTLDQHVRQLAARLQDRSAAFDETQRFVASFIRPHGLQRPATPIFADAVEALAAAPPPPPEPAPVWGAVVRGVLLAAASPVPVVNYIRHPLTRARARKRVFKVFRQARKRWERAVRYIQ